MSTRVRAPQPLGLAPHSGSPSVTLTPQARRTFQDSFENSERTIQKHSNSDHREFSDTTLRDVYEAAKQIEQQLAAQQRLRNLKRLEPLLNGLEAYSKVIEVLCNGTPYLPWIWAPIKLMMKLATDHISAFEKLISAYAQIAENLPRFDRLSTALRNPDFQQVIAVVYSDIIEFHRQAYKFFGLPRADDSLTITFKKASYRFGRILCHIFSPIRSAIPPGRQWWYATPIRS